MNKLDVKIIFATFALLFHAPNLAYSVNIIEEASPTLGSLFNAEKSNREYIFDKVDIENIFTTENGQVTFKLTFLRHFQEEKEQPISKKRRHNGEAGGKDHQRTCALSSHYCHLDSSSLENIFEEFSTDLKSVLLPESEIEPAYPCDTELVSQEFLKLPKVLQELMTQNDPQTVQTISKHFLEQPIVQKKRDELFWKKIARTEYTFERNFYLTTGRITLNLQGRPAQEAKIDLQAPIPLSIKCVEKGPAPLPLLWEDIVEKLVNHVQDTLNHIRDDEERKISSPMHH